MTDLGDIQNELQEFCQEYAIVLEGNGQDYMNKWLNRNSDRLLDLIQALLTHTLQTYRDEIVAGLPEKLTIPDNWRVLRPELVDRYESHNDVIEQVLNHINSVGEKRGV